MFTAGLSLTAACASEVANDALGDQSASSVSNDCFGGCDPSNPLVVFLFDQTANAIIRLEDSNHNGSFDTASEIGVFFDNSLPVTGLGNAQGMVATGPRTLLATDNTNKPKIVRLHDSNADGDAFDENESIIWFDGNLGTHQMAFPTDLIRHGKGWLLLDSNTTNNQVPEAVYQLTDFSANGFIDSNEVKMLQQLAAPGDSFGSNATDIAVDSNGHWWIYDGKAIPEAGETLWKIDGNQRTATLRNESFQGSTFHSFATIFYEFTAYQNGVLLPIERANAQTLGWFRDLDQNGSIDVHSEFISVWNTVSDPITVDGQALIAIRDVFTTRDQSVLVAGLTESAVVLLRLKDLDHDGLFSSTETKAIYSSTNSPSPIKIRRPIGLTAW